MIMNENSIEKCKENISEGETIKEGRINPFFKKYDTPHETAPFNEIRLEDYEEAFVEGIRRDNEQLDKIINNPEKPTFDNTLLNKDDDEDYYGLLGRVSTVFFNLSLHPKRNSCWRTVIRDLCALVPCSTRRGKTSCANSPRRRRCSRFSSRRTC